MSMRITLCALAALATTSLSAPAIARTPTTAPAALRADLKAEATRLAEVLLPEPVFAQIVGTMFESLIAESMRTDPAMRTLFADRPELMTALRTRVVPEMRAILLEELPRWRVELRDLLMGMLTAEEARSIADFIASPPGQKLYIGAIRYAADHPNQDGVDQKMFDTLMATLTPDDMKMLEAFGQTSGAAKFTRATGAIKTLAARWGDEMTRDHGPRLERAVKDALEPLTPSRKTTTT